MVPLCTKENTEVQYHERFQQQPVPGVGRVAAAAGTVVINKAHDLFLQFFSFTWSNHISIGRFSCLSCPGMANSICSGTAGSCGGSDGRCCSCR